MTVRISRSYVDPTDVDSITIGDQITSTQLSGLVNPHLHQYGMLNLHNCPCETTYRYDEVITDEPGSAEKPVELIFRGHPRLTNIILLLRAQIGDAVGAPATLAAELYTAPMPSSGAMFVWTLEDSGILWAESNGTLQPTPGDHDVFFTRVISTGLTPRNPISAPDPPRPLYVGTRADWYRIRLVPDYVRIHHASALELFNAEVAP